MSDSNQLEIHIRPATGGDVEGLVELVNSSYRGESSRRGWTTEADLLDGQRLDADLLAQELMTANCHILVMEATGLLVGCIRMERTSGIVVLSLITIRPSFQNRGLGRLLLKAAEDQAALWRAQYIEMSVIHLRTKLIDWYGRRGYTLTDVTRPFPYGDPRFGIPLREDLHFVVLRKSLAVPS